VSHQPPLSERCPDMSRRHRAKASPDATPHRPSFLPRARSRGQCISDHLQPRRRCHEDHTDSSLLSGTQVATIAHWMPPHAPCALVPSLWVAVLVSLSTPRLHKIDSPHHSSALSTVKDPPRRREQLKSADAAGSAMGVGQLPCFSKLGHQPELAVPLRWARLEASPQCTLGFSIFSFTSSLNPIK
jgi:hypothetical protein